MTIDNTLDAAIVEKAAKAIGPESCACREGHNQHGYWRRIDMSCPSCGDSEAKARAALEAVADDLRAEGFEHALDEVSASYTIPTPDNPYRKES